MLSPAALDQWKRQAHGPRVQAKAIGYISRKIDSYEMFGDAIGNFHPTLEEINKDCREFCTPDVHVATLRR